MSFTHSDQLEKRKPRLHLFFTRDTIKVINKYICHYLRLLDMRSTVPINNQQLYMYYILDVREYVVFFFVPNQCNVANL